MSQQTRSSFDWAFWFLWIMATACGWVAGLLFAPPVDQVARGCAIGILQWLVLKQRIPSVWKWIPSTAIGWTVVGVSIGLFALSTELSFAMAALLGFTTGAAQWLILRREVYWAGWWPVISVVAWTTGLRVFPAPPLVGVMPGAITGIALELLLHFARRARPVPDSADSTHGLHPSD